MVGMQIFAVLIFSVSTLFAQTGVQVSPNVVALGDVFHYKLALPNSDIIPSVNRESFAPFSVYDVQATRTSSGDVAQRLVLDIQLQAFELGQVEIPTQTIAGNIIPALPISVKASLASTSNQQLLSTLPIGRLKVTWWPYILLGLIVIIIAVLLGYFWRARQRKLLPEPVYIDPRSPEEIANEELNELLSRNLLDSGKEKVFYGELSRILRQFLERILGVSLMELTSYECLQQLRSRLDVQTSKRVENVLTEGDMVKFAKTALNSDEHETNVRRVREVIDRLSQKEGDA